MSHDQNTLKKHMTYGKGIGKLPKSPLFTTCCSYVNTIVDIIAIFFAGLICAYNACQPEAAYGLDLLGLSYIMAVLI